MLKVPFTDKDPFDSIPEGQYKAEIVDAKLLPTKDNEECSPQGNFYVQMTFKLIDEYAGKLINGRYNVKHFKPDVQQIGQSSVRRVYKAVGLTPPSQELSEDKLQQLLHRPFMLKLSKDLNDYKVEKGYDDPYDNNPRGYIALTAEQQQQIPQTQQQAQSVMQQNDKDFLDKKNAEFDDDDEDCPF